MENFIDFNFCKDKKKDNKTTRPQDHKNFLVRSWDLGFRSFCIMNYFYLKKFSK